MSKATDTQWRVQTKAKTGRWVNRGLYETRKSARAIARMLRNGQGDPWVAEGWVGYGFGNTRVVKYQKK